MIMPMIRLITLAPPVPMELPKRGTPISTAVGACWHSGRGPSLENAIVGRQTWIWWPVIRWMSVKMADVGVTAPMGALVTRGNIGMEDREIRTVLDQHWAASDANDFELEHQIYREDAVLEYPQSGERIRGRRNIQATRTLQPSRKRFKVRRVIGAGDLWVTEYVILYDGQPSYTVSIMEFEGGKVVRETQYFGDPFEASAWRSRWVEPMEKEWSLS